MSSDPEEDPIDRVCGKHVVLTQAEQAEEKDSPALQDLLMSHRHLHLPGIEEVEALALLLLELSDNSNRLTSGRRSPPPPPALFTTTTRPPPASSSGTSPGGATLCSSVSWGRLSRDQSSPENQAWLHEVLSGGTGDRGQSPVLPPPQDSEEPSAGQSAHLPLCRQHPYCWFSPHSLRLPLSCLVGHRLARALYLLHQQSRHSCPRGHVGLAMSLIVVDSGRGTHLPRTKWLEAQRRCIPNVHPPPLGLTMWCTAALNTLKVWWMWSWKRELCK